MCFSFYTSVFLVHVCFSTLGSVGESMAMEFLRWSTAWLFSPVDNLYIYYCIVTVLHWRYYNNSEKPGIFYSIQLQVKCRRMNIYIYHRRNPSLQSIKPPHKQNE
ncbi:hypothetical protein V8C43DRAFT_96855 [Trichoderma afarasin]